MTNKCEFQTNEYTCMEGDCIPTKSRICCMDCKETECVHRCDQFKYGSLSYTELKE